MSTFFLIVELLSYVFAIFLFIKKKELAIIYIPVLIFSNIVIEPVLSVSLYYAIISLLLISCIVNNNSFYQKNIFALLIFLYFIFLLPKSSDLNSIRPYIYSVSWLFISVPLIATIYNKYDRGVIFKEVTNSALLILVLFVANVIFSTIFRYAPAEMYNITRGILYGNMYAANFNVLTIAIFITVLKLIDKKSLFHLIVLVLTLSFLLLSMRRSVMISSSLGVLIALLTVLTEKGIKKFVFFGCVIFLIGYVIYANTGFMDVFNERYELRNLSERELEGEGRFLEYELLYKDMFVYNEYSPWFGYELFNSGGNYGRGIFDLRTLHSDLTNIAHSSGLVGVALYLLMVVTAFAKSFSATSSKRDKLIVFFCVIAFVTFTITGRYTQVDSMMLIYLILMLPLAKESNTNILLDEMDLQVKYD